MKKLPPMTTSHFGDLLQQIRKENGIKLAVLAMETSYSESTFECWLSGDRRPPRGDTIATIARVCGVRPFGLCLAAARDTGELSIDVTGLSPAEIQTLLRQIAEAAC